MNIKKISVILNIILLGAVVVLYVLYFLGKDQEPEKQVTETKKTEQQRKESAILSDKSIAYINFDTLLMNYAYVQKLQKQLEEKREELSSELESESSNFQKEVSGFQEKVKKGLITSFKAKKRQKELQQKQQQLQQYQSEVSRKLAEKQRVTNRKILDRVRSFLKQYNRDHQYKFIISNSFSGPLLYAEKSTNITEEVVEGLNRQYINRQKQSK